MVALVNKTSAKRKYFFLEWLVVKNCNIFSENGQYFSIDPTESIDKIIFEEVHIYI